MNARTRTHPLLLLLTWSIVGCSAPSDATDTPGPDVRSSDVDATVVAEVSRSDVSAPTDLAHLPDGSIQTSPGCGQQTPPLGPIVEGPSWGVGPDHTYSLDVDGLTRRFVLRLPDGYHRDRAYPVVFLFHGTGGSGQDYDYSRIEQATPPGAAIFVLPVGLDYQWAVENWPGDAYTGWETFNDDERDLAFFDALWAHVSGAYCVDRARVFASGHSIGGYMTNYVACKRGDVLRAVAPIAGGGPWPGYTTAYGCGPGQVAAMVVHGEADNVVLPDRGQESLDHYRTMNGCADSATTRAASVCAPFDGCDEGFVVQLCSYPGVGHSDLDWPTVGASIWAFFGSF